MSIVSTMKMTAQQFLLLGEDPPGVRLELVNGEVAVSPGARWPHSRADRRLTQILLNHVDAYDLGDVLGDMDTIFGEYDVRRPDIIYYSKARLSSAFTLGALTEPPDLCIEIVSPSSVTIDRRDKFNQYASKCVPCYWIVDPRERTIEEYVLENATYRLAGQGAGDELVTLSPFPDLKIPLGKLWLPDEA